MEYACQKAGIRKASLDWTPNFTDHLNLIKSFTVAALITKFVYNNVGNAGNDFIPIFVTFDYILLTLLRF